jgi:hypothetical protein
LKYSKVKSTASYSCSDGSLSSLRQSEEHIYLAVRDNDEACCV